MTAFLMGLHVIDVQQKLYQYNLPSCLQEFSESSQWMVLPSSQLGWLLALSSHLGQETPTIEVVVDGALFGSQGMPERGNLCRIPPNQERRKMGDSAAAAVD